MDLPRSPSRIGRSAALLAALLALIVAGLAAGAPAASAWSDPSTILDPTPLPVQWNGKREYATDARNGLMVSAWREGDGSVWLQTRRDAWSAPEAVAPAGTAGSTGPAGPVEVQLSDEGAYVTWEAEDGAISVRRKDLATLEWDAPREVLGAADYRDWVQFAVNARGDMVFRTDNGEDSPNTQTVVIRSVGNGWEERRVPYVSNDDRFRNIHATAISDAGHIVFAGPGEGGARVYRWPRESDAPVGKTLKRAGDDPRLSFDVEVGIDGTGRITVTWTQQRYRNGVGSSLYHRIETASGSISGAFGAVSVLDDGGPDDPDDQGDEDPLLRVNERGDAVVAWKHSERHPIAINGSPSVQVRTRRPGGTWSSIQQITPVSRDPYSPYTPHLLALDESGNAGITFHRQYGEGGQARQALEGAVASGGAFGPLGEIYSVLQQDANVEGEAATTLHPLSVEMVAGTPEVVFAREVRNTSQGGGAVEEHKVLASSNVPRAVITAGPDGPTGDDTPTFEFEPDGGGEAAFECRMDGQPAAFAACGSPKTYEALADGEHRFEVRARRGTTAAGPVASRVFTVDTLAPAATVETVTLEQTRATFALESSEEGSLACALNDGAFAPCQSPHELDELTPSTTYTLRVRATDAVGNEGDVVEHAFTTLGELCEATRGPGGYDRAPSPFLRFGVAEVIGCFEQTAPGKFTNGTAGIRLNGIDVSAPKHSLAIDTNAWTINSGDTVVRFSVSGQMVWAGTLNRKFSSAAMAAPFSHSVESTAFKALPLSGSLKLGMVAPTGDAFSGATQLTVVGQVPSTFTVKFGTAPVGSLQFVMRTQNDTGLQPGTITGTLGQVQIGKFKTSNLLFAYDFAKDAWTAEVDFALPFPRVPQAGGSVTVTKGKVTAFTARTDGLEAGHGIYLQRLSLGGSTSDDGKTFTATGGGGFSVGPKVPLPDGTDVEAVSGDGTVSYAFSDPGLWTLSAALKMVNVPLADGVLRVNTVGKVDFEGRAHLHGNVGSLKLFNAEGKLFGFADRDVSWQAQGAVHHVKFLNWSFGDDANAQALASSKGMIVCAGKAGHRVGFSYDYSHYSAIGKKCDVGKMAVVRGRPGGRSAARAAAGDQAKVTIAEGETLAVFAGKAAGEAPRLSVSGPDGTAITTPESGVAQTGSHLVGQDGEGRTYVVVFDPPAGTYDIASDRPLEEIAAADSTAGGDAPPTPVLVDPPPQVEPTPEPAPGGGSPAAPGPGGPAPVKPVPPVAGGPFAPSAQAAAITGVALKRVALKTALRKGVRLTGASSAPVTLSASLSVTAKTARKLKLGKKAIVLARASRPAGAGRFAVQLKIRRKLARKLRRVRKLPLTLTGTATTAAGTRTSFTARRVLRR